MNFYAALLLLSFLMAAPAQAQYNLSVDEMMDRRMSGEPILDPKLELLIRDVDFANYRAVEFHNEKFLREVRKHLPIDRSWTKQHASLVARWTAWDDRQFEWFRKKKVEASASAVVPGGAIKVRDMDAIEVQNKTMLVWKSVLIGVGQLDENKGVLSGLDDLDDLWSEFLVRLDKLDRAINALRKY